MDDISAFTDLLVADGAMNVIQYGSSVRDTQDCNDIDLFAICDDAVQRENFELGHWDVIRLTEDQFHSYTERLDPVYCTEPLLTGELIYGDDEWYQDTKTEVQSITPSQQVIDHNLIESFNEYRRAMNHLHQGHPTEAAKILSFSISHWIYAQWYSQGNSAASLHQVVEASVYEDHYRSTRQTMKADLSESARQQQVQTALLAWRDTLLARHAEE